MEGKTRESYVESLIPGNIIAFQMNDHMYSGKVVKVEEEGLVVKTKNGSIYYPNKSQVAWVKNGTHWPQGIYNALKLNSKE